MKLTAFEHVLDNPPRAPPRKIYKFIAPGVVIILMPLMNVNTFIFIHVENVDKTSSSSPFCRVALCSFMVQINIIYLNVFRPLRLCLIK